MNTLRTLIIGGGISGLSVAGRLERVGVPCLIVERKPELGGIAGLIGDLISETKQLQDAIADRPEIETMLETEPVRIRGVRGHFLVELQSRLHRHSETFENIVFATGLNPVFPVCLHPDGPMPGMITLLDLENLRRKGWEFPSSGRILFVTGYGQNHYPFTMTNVLKQALSLRTVHRNVVVVMDRMLFENPWMPDMYQRCRESGVRFIWSRSVPEFRTESRGLMFRIPDMALSTSGNPVVVEGRADWVVFEPEYQPVTFPNLFWSPHDIDRDLAGFYGAPSLRLESVRSGRAGIWLVGSIRGPKSVELCYQEAALAVADILGGESSSTIAVVDEAKCSLCLTCVRFCPHHAVMIDHVARISDRACLGCGICVAECPAKAIGLHGRDGCTSDSTELTRELQTGDIVVFCCEGSSWIAASHAERNGLLAGLSLRLNRVPCSGNIRVLDILRAYQGGAAGVFIAMCQDGHCNHLTGNHRALRRVTHCRKILETLGLNPTTLEIQPVAAQMDRQFAQMIRRFSEMVGGSPR